VEGSDDMDGFVTQSNDANTGVIFSYFFTLIKNPRISILHSL